MGSLPNKLWGALEPWRVHLSTAHVAMSIKVFQKVRHERRGCVWQRMCSWALGLHIAPLRAAAHRKAIGKSQQPKEEEPFVTRERAWLFGIP